MTLSWHSVEEGVGFRVNFSQEMLGRMPRDFLGWMSGFPYRMTSLHVRIIAVTILGHPGQHTYTDRQTDSF